MRSFVIVRPSRFTVVFTEPLAMTASKFINMNYKRILLSHVYCTVEIWVHLLRYLCEMLHVEINVVSGNVMFLWCNVMYTDKGLPIARLLSDWQTLGMDCVSSESWPVQDAIITTCFLYFINVVQGTHINKYLPFYNLLTLIVCACVRVCGCVYVCTLHRPTVCVLYSIHVGEDR